MIFYHLSNVAVTAIRVTRLLEYTTLFSYLWLIKYSVGKVELIHQIEMTSFLMSTILYWKMFIELKRKMRHRPRGSHQINQNERVENLT